MKQVVIIIFTLMTLGAMLGVGAALTYMYFTSSIQYAK